ncbi:hypothetical protein NECAME_07815 [Necator americanus]|uniref:Uncharacterized protein n=1 Tax=Necator americanus TaxID=51031 RepID=W2TP58_NECAM|nr:hypothetical protein NECAME_07815 [Necator americanus]ETN82757.1 hypothetical protein NECAME_07815 [Necator americanus]
MNCSRIRGGDSPTNDHFQYALKTLKKAAVPRNPSLLITQVQKNGGATNGTTLSDTTTDDFLTVTAGISPTILPEPLRFDLEKRIGKLNYQEELRNLHNETQHFYLPPLPPYIVPQVGCRITVESK